MLVVHTIHSCPAAVALFVGVLLAAQIVSADDPESAARQIDQLMQQYWSQLKVTPAAQTTDEQFVRRVFLDVVGRIPTIQERETFLADQREHKREHLVDVLLSSEDSVQHLADVFDTLLMGRGERKDDNRRRQHQWRSWLETVFRDNRPWNDVVADILIARPQSPADQGVVWFLYERENRHQEIAEAIAPAFFGIRIECAQCHDHMVAIEIEQRHYWGLVAFFNRSQNRDTPQGPRVAESAIGGFSEFANLEGGSSPNLLTFFQARTVPEARPEKDAEQQDRDELYVASNVEGAPRVPKFSRREAFVNEIVRDHPLIARAFVNRIWALLLGRGIVHPFDEMDSVHPPAHPELLDWLAEDFRESNGNIRRLIRMIVLSQAYQLQSQRPTGVDDPASFAWGLEKPLTAEQLSRSIQLAIQGTFRNDHPLTAQFREAFPQVLPETVTTPVADALFLSNHPALNEFIVQSRAEDQLIPRLLKLDSSDEQIDLAFRTIFGRDPDPSERQQFTRYLDEAERDPEAQRRRWEQVIWAMVTSAEFRFNH